MNDMQLKRSLQSIGKSCFVRYLSYFFDFNLTVDDVIEKLKTLEGYEESGCRTRVSQARRIILSGRLSDALEIIINSCRLESDIRRMATQLQSKYTGSANLTLD